MTIDTQRETDFNRVAAGTLLRSEDQWAELDAYRRWQFDLIRERIGSRVLEVGAGDGSFAELISTQLAPRRLLLVEPSQELFQVIQTRQARGTLLAEARRGVLSDVPLAEKFDTIIAVHVMEHVEDDRKFVQAALERLDHGGRIILLVPALGWLYSKFDRKVGHFRRYDKGMLRSLARECGCSLETLRYDNLAGVLGWLWLCKLRGADPEMETGQESSRSYFRIFSEWVLPVTSAVEKVIPPPIGLNLTAILKRQGE